MLTTGMRSAFKRSKKVQESAVSTPCLFRVRCVSLSSDPGNATVCLRLLAGQHDVEPSLVHCIVRCCSCAADHASTCTQNGACYATITILLMGAQCLASALSSSPASSSACGPTA